MSSRRSHRQARNCAHCRPIDGHPGMFTCYRTNATLLVLGAPAPGSALAKPSVCHEHAVDVTTKGAPTAEELHRLFYADSVRARFAAAAAAVFAPTGDLLQCPCCRLVVRRAGAAHHRRGIACIAAGSERRVREAGRSFDGAGHPAVRGTSLITYAKRLSGKKPCLEDAATVPAWVPEILQHISEYGAAMDAVCTALRDLGAACLRDRSTYSSPWRRVAEALLTRLTRDLLLAASEDPSERDFVMALLATDPEQFHAYLPHRAEALVRETYTTNAADVAARGARGGY